MVSYARNDLQFVLGEGCERIRIPKSTVLFRSGEKCVGMFVVLSGEVSLDVGTPSPLAHSYGPGALIGLPAALSHQNYSMTATVTEDAELSVWTPEELNGLLAARPDICQQLLALMGERIAENREILKAILSGDIRPPQNSTLV